MIFKHKITSLEEAYLFTWLRGLVEVKPGFF